MLGIIMWWEMLFVVLKTSAINKMNETCFLDHSCSKLTVHLNCMFVTWLLLLLSADDVRQIR